MNKQSSQQRALKKHTPITTKKPLKKAKKMTKKTLTTAAKRSFHINPQAQEPQETVPFDGNHPEPIARRKSIKWNERNPHKNDEMVEEDREKIDKFLEPLGLGNYKDKFTSFDQVLMTKTFTLKNEFGMACKERKLLRKHANYYRVGLYYKTGEIYQPKYQFREGIRPCRFHNDLTSEDDFTFALPAKDGLYRAYLRYPGSSYRDNHRAGTWNDVRFMVNNSPSAKLTPEQRILLHRKPLDLVLKKSPPIRTICPQKYIELYIMIKWLCGLGITSLLVKTNPQN